MTTTLFSDSDHLKPLNLRAFGLLCGAYYCANFILRWAADDFFGGHGAYGWPKPDALGVVAMVLGVLSSAMIVFLAIPSMLIRLSEVASTSQSTRRVSGAIIVAGLILAIAYADVNNRWYAMSKVHLRYSDIGLLLQTSEMGLSVAHVASAIIAVLFHISILWAAYLGISWWSKDRAVAVPRGAGPHRAVVAALLLVVGAGFLASSAMVHQQSDQWASIARRNLYDVSASRFVRYRHPDAASLEDILGSLRNRQAQDRLWDKPDAPPQGAAAMPRVRQILILAIEGWNARFFEPETMPFLSEISKHFVVFPRHYSSGNNTLLGINGIVFGQTPALFFEQRAINAASEPIRRFRDNGFSIRRFAVHSNYRNFGSYMTGVEEDIDSRSTSTSETFPLIRRHLKAHDRTLSLYYYGDSHYPYRHATEYSRFQPEAEESMTIPSAATPVETAKIVNRYRNALSEADARLEELFASIDWKSMVVVVTGDHGESMMENGRLSHSSSLEEPQIRTPMLLYFPGVRPAVFQGTSSHLDIMPTLLHVAGLGTVTGLHGSSLLLGGSGRHALVAHNNQDSRPLRLAVVSDKSKLVLDISDIREPRLVDLLTLDDRVARLQDVGRVDVEKSLEFVLDVLASSGCLQNYSASTNGSGSPPLRHCRAGR